MGKEQLPRIREKKTKAGSYAVVTLPDGCGGRRDVSLGRYGTPESRERYKRTIAEWLANDRTLPQASNVTITDLIARYWSFAERYYGRREEMANIRISFRPMNFLYGGLLAKDFGPLKLKSVRELMVKGYDHPKYGTQKPLARKNVNDRIGRIKRLFRWAVEEELVPASVFHGVQAVAGLRRGKTDAHECPPVKPVPQAFVDAVKTHVSPQVAAMIELQELTAMRPGEVVIMRTMDLETSGKVWIYRPSKHKLENREISREVYLGPKAQAIVKQWLKADVAAYLFSPLEAREQRFEIMRANRQSKVQPSQVNRKKGKPEKLPGERYTVESYRRAIKYGCKAAKVPAWGPNRLRHNAATNLRKQHGIELARIILGHSTAFTTEIYAEADKAQARAVVARIG